MNSEEKEIKKNTTPKKKTTKKVEGKPHPEQLSAVFRGECWKIDAGTRAGI